MTDVTHVLARLSGIGFDVRRDVDPGPGWWSPTAWAEDDARVRHALVVSGARFGRPEVSADTALWLVADVAATIAWSSAATLLVAGVVPAGQADDVRLPAPAARMLGARFAGATASAGAPGLASLVVEVVRPVVEAVHVVTRRGRRGLWAATTDAVAAACLSVGQQLGRRETACRVGDLAVASSATLVGGTNWRTLRCGDADVHTRTSNVCCRWHATDEGGWCVTCPKIDDATRRRLTTSATST